jgi:hypothetical protein
MSTTACVTADELLALPTGMGKRYELIAGELRVYSARNCCRRNWLLDYLYGRSDPIIFR